MPSLTSQVLELEASTTGNEIAAIIHTENLNNLQPYNILIWQNRQPHPHPCKVNIFSSQYEPLQYPIIFPHGTTGWHADAHLSQIRWYCSCLLQEEQFTIFGQLTCEYLVDMYSRVEEERLAYIRRGREQQRIQLQDQNFRDDIDTGEDDENQKNITLPSTFLGSRAWASEQVADSLAIYRRFGSFPYLSL